jgi:hypothetical protein
LVLAMQGLRYKAGPPILRERLWIHGGRFNFPLLSLRAGKCLAVKGIEFLSPPSSLPLT